MLDRACPGHFVALVLTGRFAMTAVAWTAPLCRPGVEFVARPGTTIYHLSVQTVYASCIMVGHKAQGNTPQCLAGDQMPPLPPGRYSVSLAEADLKLENALAGLRSAQMRITG